MELFRLEFFQLSPAACGCNNASDNAALSLASWDCIDLIEASFGVGFEPEDRAQSHTKLIVVKRESDILEGFFHQLCPLVKFNPVRRELKSHLLQASLYAVCIVVATLVLLPFHAFSGAPLDFFHFSCRPFQFLSEWSHFFTTHFILFNSLLLELIEVLHEFFDFLECFK